MKDINFAWPFYYGISFWLMAVGAFFWFVKKIFEGQFSLSLLLTTALLGLIGWIFVKIAYTNKEADTDTEITNG